MENITFDQLKLLIALRFDRHMENAISPFMKGEARGECTEWEIRKFIKSVLVINELHKSEFDLIPISMRNSYEFEEFIIDRNYRIKVINDFIKELVTMQERSQMDKILMNLISWRYVLETDHVEYCKLWILVSDYVKEHGQE